MFPSPTQNPPKTLKNSHGLAGTQGVQRSWSTARLRTSAASCTRGPAARPMLLLRSACDCSHVFPTAVNSTKRPQSKNKKYPSWIGAKFLFAGARRSPSRKTRHVTSTQ